MSTLSTLMSELPQDQLSLMLTWGKRSVYCPYFSTDEKRRTGWPQYIIEEDGDYRFATDEEVEYVMFNYDYLLKHSKKPTLNEIAIPA